MDDKAAEKAAGPYPERLDFEEQFQGPPGPLPLLNELDQLLAPSDLQVVLASPLKIASGPGLAGVRSNFVPLSAKRRPLKPQRPRHWGDLLTLVRSLAAVCQVAMTAIILSRVV